MKHYLICLFLLFFSLLFFGVGISSLKANPFSTKVVIRSKKATQSITNDSQNRAAGVKFVIEQIQYQGRLNLPNKRAGNFFFKDKKYLVQEGEKIGNIKIVDIKKDYILLLQGKKLYKVNKH